MGHNDENNNKIFPTHSEHSDKARRAILKLYTYESPLYKTINDACCRQDERVVPTLGPFATLLCYTIEKPPTTTVEKMKENFTGKEKDKWNEEVDIVTLYRSLGLP